MTIAVDEATKVITVDQSDLTLVTGSLYELDTNDFRLSVGNLMDDERYIWMDDPFRHNTEVTVAGVTYARTIECINGYSVEFTPDISYSVRLVGSNNNLFDVENGVFIANQVLPIPTNSAGLQTVTSGSGVTQQDKDDIENQIFTRVIDGTLTFEHMSRLLTAMAAGDIVQQTDGTYVIKSTDGVKDRISGDDAANGGRTITDTDVT